MKDEARVKHKAEEKDQEEAKGLEIEKALEIAEAMSDATAGSFIGAIAGLALTMTDCTDLHCHRRSCTDPDHSKANHRRL